MFQDFRSATRHLRRHPGFLLLGSAALGLGLGATILVFGIADTLLLRPLPGISHELHQLEIGRVDASGRLGAVSFPDFVDVLEHATTVDRVFAYHLGPAYVGGRDGTDPPVAALSMLVSGNYFEAMGVRAAHGQLINPAFDEAPGRDPVVVLSHAAFERHFDSEPSILGRPLRVNGSPFVVIGVTAPGFRGHIAPVAPELFVPLSMAEAMQVRDDAARHARGDNWLELGGVLAGGATLEQASAELATLSAILPERQEAYEDPWTFGAVSLQPLPQRTHGMLRFLAAGLLILCGAILVLAATNLAGVLLAQGEARAGEFATRTALGASRGRIVRQLLVESGLVAVLAGGLGLSLAVLGRNLLRLVPLPLPFPVELGIVIDWRVVLFAGAVSALVAFGFGLVPALRVSGVSPARLMRAGRTAHDGSGRVGWSGRSILLAAQSSLTVLLLLVAAFTVLALDRAARVDSGFRTAGVHIAHLDMTPLGVRGEAAADRIEQLADRLRELPGVNAATFATIVPLTGEQLGYGPARQVGVGGDAVDLRVNVVGEGFFEVFNVPVRGEGIDRTHRADGPPVAVINRRLALRVFGDEEPIGREFEMGRGESARRLLVIGTVPDGRYASLEENDRAFAFLPASQWERSRFSLFVHGSIEPETLRRELARALGQVLPDMPPPVIHRFEDAAALSILPQRLLGLLAAGLGVLALILAATGIYGVLAYQIERRFRELGLRRALGASELHIARVLLSRTVVWLLGGAVVGVLLAQLAAAAMRGMLFGVGGADPLALGTVLVAFGVMAAVAIAHPLRRALGLEPMEALRRE